MTSKSTRTKKAADITRTDNGSSSGTTKIVDTTNGVVTGGVDTPTPGADGRAKALVEAFAKAATGAGGSPLVTAAPATAPHNTTNDPTTNLAAVAGANNVRFLDLQRRLAAVAASSPVAASALMNAIQKRVAAKSAMTVNAAGATTPNESALSTSSSEDLAVALAKATVRRFAALERLQLEQQFQRQQRALLLEHQKLDAHHKKQYQANMQLLLAANHMRQQQQEALLSSSSSSNPETTSSSPTMLEKLLADRKEQEERAAALLALRLPR
jgi:hypothetical protein